MEKSKPKETSPQPPPRVLKSSNNYTPSFSYPLATHYINPSTYSSHWNPSFRGWWNKWARNAIGDMEKQEKTQYKHGSKSEVDSESWYWLLLLPLLAASAFALPCCQACCCLELLVGCWLLPCLPELQLGCWSCWEKPNWAVSCWSEEGNAQLGCELLEWRRKGPNGLELLLEWKNWNKPNWAYAIKLKGTKAQLGFPPKGKPEPISQAQLGLPSLLLWACTLIWNVGL